MFNRRRRPDSDFSEELKAHLALEEERFRAEGMSAEEAWHAARRSLGNLRGAEERFYESTRWVWLENLAGDTRYALRRLRKAPAFATTAILTLALGVGATTAIFTLVHAVLRKSLPVADPDQLYRLGRQVHCCVWGGYNQDPEFSIISFELYRYLRDHTKGFEEMAAFQAGSGNDLGVRREHSSNAAQTLVGKFVSGNYFRMFGIHAYAGRALTPDDDRQGAPPAAVMTYQVWQRKFGSDPSVVGSVFAINGKPFTVVGITPPGFFGDTLSPQPPNFFLPIAQEPLIDGDGAVINNPNQHWLEVIGRIGPHSNVSAIEAQMRVVLMQWLHSHEGDMQPGERTLLPKQTLYLSPGGAGITSMRQDYEHWLNILMAISSFVLVIVCANVANLMLVRGLEHRQQTSLSMALGARPLRLVRQALTESVVLAVIGGIAGLAVAFAGTRLILHFAFDTATSTVPISAMPSLPVLAFALGVSLITGIVFGIAPAWMATRVDPVEALRGANRSTRRTGSLPRKTLVVIQAALSLTLLCAAGLLVQALRSLEHQDFGFEPQNRMVLNIDPVLAGYRPDQLPALYRRIHDTLAAVPGVASVATALYTPLSGDSWNEGVFVEGRPAPDPSSDSGAIWSMVTPGYFDTIGNRVVRGRPITEQDTSASRRVAVVNESFTRKFFKNQNAIGQHFGRGDGSHSADYEIVGIVKDIRYVPYNLTGPVRPFFFAAHSQSTSFKNPDDANTEFRAHYMHDIVVRMAPGAPFPEAAVRRAMASVDSNLPVLHIQTMAAQVASNFSQQRLIAQLTSLFGILALVLASIGLYGVTAHSVGSRINEIGVRMALGADSGDVLTLILRGAFALVGFGLLLGVPLALGAGRFLKSQLYGANQYDPLILSIAVAALGIPALVAALIPALRASSIQPMQALRTD